MQQHVIVVKSLEEKPAHFNCNSMKEKVTLSNGDKVFECSHGKALYYSKSERKYY